MCLETKSKTPSVLKFISSFKIPMLEFLAKLTPKFQAGFTYIFSSTLINFTLSNA